MTTAVPTGSIEGDHSVENDIVDISVHEEMNVNLHEIASRPVVKPVSNLEAVRKRYSQIASYKGQSATCAFSALSELRASDSFSKHDRNMDDDDMHARDDDAMTTSILSHNIKKQTHGMDSCASDSSAMPSTSDANFLKSGHTSSVSSRVECDSEREREREIYY